MSSQNSLDSPKLCIKCLGLVKLQLKQTCIMQQEKNKCEKSSFIGQKLAPLTDSPKGLHVFTPRISAEHSGRAWMNVIKAVDEESSSSDCNEDDMCDNTEERSAGESEEADDKYAILEVDNGSDSDYEDLDMVEPQSVLPQVVLEVVVVHGNEVVKCPHEKKFLDENNEKDKEKRSILIDTLVCSLAIIKQIPHFQ